jgi:hypothetical protein
MKKNMHADWLNTHLQRGPMLCFVLLLCALAQGENLRQTFLDIAKSTVEHRSLFTYSESFGKQCDRPSPREACLRQIQSCGGSLVAVRPTRANAACSSRSVDWLVPTSLLG